MKPLILFLLASGIVFPVCEKDMVNPATREMSSVRGYRNWYIGNYRCGIYVPVNYSSDRSYPLIIYLHGYTDTTTHDLEWYHEPIISKDPCIVLTPKCPKEEIFNWGDTYGPETSPAIEKTYKMIEMAEKAFNLDADRYYIYGISMGGYGTYGVIQKHPDMFAAGYVLCGAGNTDIAPVLSAIPFWIFHGSADNVVPVEASRDLYQVVLKCGGKQIRYTEYAGVGHNVWDYTRHETTLQTWLLAQHKGSAHGVPNAVRGFTGELSDKKIDLRWEVPAETAPPSDTSIWYCRIYRNGSVIKEIYNNQQSFIDTWLLTNYTYEYRISAVNYYFKESPLSAPISFTITK